MRYQLRNNCAHLKMKATQFGSWLLKKHTARCMVLYHGACMHQKSQGGHTKCFCALKLPSCGLVAFKKYIYLHLNTYLLIEGGRSFNYFGQLLLIYWKMLNMELNMTLIVFMGALDISEIYSRFDEYLAIYAEDEFDSLLICNIRFCVIYLFRSKFLTSHDCSRIFCFGKHCNKLRHWLLWKHFC